MTAGDGRSALEDYVRRHGDRLLRTAYLLTGDRADAEDVLQNALAGLLVSRHRLDRVDNLDAYVHTAVVNARRTWWRRHRHDPEPVAEPGAGGDPGFDPYDDRYADHDEIVRALRRLPHRQRAAVVLRYLEDLGEPQVAAILGCSVGTVKSQTARGIAKLRAELGPTRLVPELV